MNRLNELHSNYKLTPHAQKAAQQRGIKLQTLQCVLYNADVRNRRGEGKMSFAISKKKMKQLRSLGYSSKIIEDSSSIVVLVEPIEKRVISVWHSCRKSNRRDYNTEPHLFVAINLINHKNNFATKYRNLSRTECYNIYVPRTIEIVNIV